MSNYTYERWLKECSQKSHVKKKLERKTPCQNNKDGNRRGCWEGW